MLIINADDWGRSEAETDAALECYRHGRITSVSAMVFMSDSERAANLAQVNGLDVGLHLNFSEPFKTNRSASLDQAHRRVVAFLTRSKYSQLFYNPFLRTAFSDSFRAQLDEFLRLFNRMPSHIDGHHHMHLCANLLFSSPIAAGTKMRRNFSFWPGEKSVINRAYRALIDHWLRRQYETTDYFFDLSQCIEENTFERMITLAKSSAVELMTHPVVVTEFEHLMSDAYGRLLQQVEIGSYEEFFCRSSDNKALAANAATVL